MNRAITVIKLVHFFFNSIIRNKSKIFFLPLMPVWISCNSSQVVRIDDMQNFYTEECIGKKIDIPDSLLVLINNNQEYIHETNILAKRFMIITLIYNSDCAKCDYIKINAWKDYLKKLDQYKNIGLVVIYCGYNEYFKRIIYPEIAFSSPVILDRECVFISRNKLPDSEEFNTLLLDENNKVLLIGDPTQNAETERLYINKISELK